MLEAGPMHKQGDPLIAIPSAQNTIVEHIIAEHSRSLYHLKHLAQHSCHQ